MNEEIHNIYWDIVKKIQNANDDKQLAEDIEEAHWNALAKIWEQREWKEGQE